MTSRILPLALLLALPSASQAVGPLPEDDMDRAIRILARDYRLLGLPVPPRDALLMVSGEKIGFVYREPGGGVVFLSGLDPRPIADLWNRPVGLPPPVRELPKGVAIPGPDFVVQCSLAGHRELARFIAEGQFTLTAISDARGRLRWRAGDLWVRRIWRRDSDWGKVLPRLRVLRQLGETDWKLRFYIDGIEATLAEYPSRPGTTKALFDDLIRDPAHFHWGFPEPSRLYRKLRYGGFTYVPALIEALGDRRLTRRVVHGLRGDHILRVDEVAAELLKEIAGENLAIEWHREAMLKGRPRPYISQDAVRAWWAKASAEGEEAYFVRQVYQSSSDSSSEFHLNLLIRKYPASVNKAYLGLLRDRPELAGRRALDVIARSKLPSRVRRAVVMLGATKGSPIQRVAALAHLRDIDASAFLRMLTKELEGMPNRWKDSNGRHEFASLVDYLDDDHLWLAYLKAVKRADAQLRMRLLDRFRPNGGGLWTRRQFALYASHLGDRAVMAKDAPDNPTNGRTAFTCGHLLAYRVGEQLRLPPPRDKADAFHLSDSRKEWDAFRDKVAAALKRKLAEMEKE